MSEKIYLIFLILCGILFQGIIGSSLEDNQDNSSNLHLRKKRMVGVVGHSRLGLGDWIPNGFIHIVQVLYDDEKICAGVIVTPEHILTGYECVRLPKNRYIIDSRATPLSPIQPHIVNHLDAYEDSAIFMIHPCIPGTYGALARPIALAISIMRPNAHPVIIAWWPGGGIRPITNVMRVDLQTCRNRYSEHNIQVTPDYYCTFLPVGESRLTLKDLGSALVVGDELYGVLVRAGVEHGELVPDLFADVDGMYYHSWLRSHIGHYLANSHFYDPQNHRQTRV